MIWSEMRVTHGVAIVALVALILAGGIVAGEEAADIGTDHDLATEDAMEKWETNGYAEGDADRYQLTLAVAENRGDVGAGDAMTTDIRNQYLRLDYQEDYPRELRVLLPRAVITPYQAEDVGSLTSDHVAEMQPARSGEYLEVVVSVDGPSEIVLPLNRDHALSYSFLERTDKRIKQITGISPLDRDAEWNYVDGKDIAAGGTYSLNLTGEDLAVQFDATPESATETWLNVPRGETVSAPVYLREYDDRYTLIATTENPPTIRHRDEATLPAQVRGWVTEATEIPNNIMDKVNQWLPWGE